MKAGIVCDTWKLPIFERRLKAAHYDYKVIGEFTKDTTTITVTTDNLMALQEVVKAANTEAARTGKPK